MAVLPHVLAVAAAVLRACDVGQEFSALADDFLERVALLDREGEALEALRAVDAVAEAA